MAPKEKSHRGSLKWARYIHATAMAFDINNDLSHSALWAMDSLVIKAMDDILDKASWAIARDRTMTLTDKHIITAIKLSFDTRPGRLGAEIARHAEHMASGFHTPGFLGLRDHHKVAGIRMQLAFPVGRIHTMIRGKRVASRTSVSAAIALAAALQAMISGVLATAAASLPSTRKTITRSLVSAAFVPGF
jgi:histone H3/H4